MNLKFFEKLIGKEVNITYRDNNKENYTEGIVGDVDERFVVVMNSFCSVAITYDAILTCKVKNGDGK